MGSPMTSAGGEDSLDDERDQHPRQVETLLLVAALELLSRVRWPWTERFPSWRRRSRSDDWAGGGVFLKPHDGQTMVFGFAMGALSREVGSVFILSSSSAGRQLNRCFRLESQTASGAKRAIERCGGIGCQTARSARKGTSAPPVVSNGIIDTALIASHE